MTHLHGARKVCTCTALQRKHSRFTTNGLARLRRCTRTGA